MLNFARATLAVGATAMFAALAVGGETPPPTVPATKVTSPAPSPSAPASPRAPTQGTTTQRAPTPSASTPSAPTPGAPTPGASTSSGEAASPAAPMNEEQVIQLLDQTIDWYRTLGIQQQTANEPSDLLILYDNRQTAGRVLALAFEIARADADMLARQPAPGSAANQESASLTQMQSQFATQGDSVRSQLAGAQRSLSSAAGGEAVKLRAKISALQGELDLINTRKTLLDTMMSISNDNDANGFSAASLKTQIDAMAITVPTTSSLSPASPTAATGPTAAGGSPATTAGSAASPPPAALATSSVSLATRFGIWDLAANVLRSSEKIATIDNLDRRTAALQTAFTKIRDPLVTQTRALSVRGDALATQADTADAGTLTQMRTQLDALAAQIKQASTLLVPLGKEDVLLSQHRRNLANWRSIIESQYKGALQTLGVRLLILAVLLLLVFTAAELWRRTVMNYVQDTRRRYQLLLLRKIALWGLTVAIVGFAFSSELGSIVTFAGLITAGLAVAMQSVLVSIVGYFFLIGKYGLRVGDRVQIGEVTGEVIELGLVRLHLMEIGGHGQLGPTGRVVAFANSVVFQVASGLFKQIPGVNFAWHEIALTLPAGIDYAAAQDKLTKAVTTALTDSHDEIVRQTREIERTTAARSGGDSRPRVQLNFAGGGIEARIRYPVHLSDAAEIDDRVSRELIGVIAELAPPAAASKPA